MQGQSTRLLAEAVCGGSGQQRQLSEIAGRSQRVHEAAAAVCLLRAVAGMVGKGCGPGQATLLGAAAAAAALVAAVCTAVALAAQQGGGGILMDGVAGAVPAPAEMTQHADLQTTALPAAPGPRPGHVHRTCLHRQVHQSCLDEHHAVQDVLLLQDDLACGGTAGSGERARQQQGWESHEGKVWQLRRGGDGQSGRYRTFASKGAL